MTIKELATSIQQRFPEYIQEAKIAWGELTVELAPEKLLAFCQILRDEPEFKFEILIDIAGVDYLEYGMSEWVTNKATTTGFSRAVDTKEDIKMVSWNKPRFAAVYHLLSITHNQRIRLRVFADETSLTIPSVIKIWSCANWYEREAFDLYGIMFEGHPDLRRILTDYGFIGYPFRKDFPLSGQVEVRYDATAQQVLYEPVDIEPRITVPKVIRDESRVEEPDARNT